MIRTKILALLLSCFILSTCASPSGTNLVRVTTIPQDSGPTAEEVEPPDSTIYCIMINVPKQHRAISYKISD